MARTVPGNARTVVATVFVPDAWAVQVASLGIMTNSFSPGAAGIHTSGTQRGFSMDRGSGVNGNRWAGRTQQIQAFHGAARPVADPRSRRLGAGHGASAQPGLPSTGQDNGGLAALAWMGYSQLGNTAMGGV